MAPPKDSNPYDLQATDAKKALAQEGYDDCLACRATGILYSPSAGECQSSNALFRVGCVYRTGNLQLLYGDEQSAEAGARDPEECHEI